MLQVVGNLSERGMSFFFDRKMKYEIAQDSVIDIDSEGSIEFFIGVRHRYEGDKRYGQILSLEENYLSFMVDMVEEVQGVPFRNYDNISNIELEVEFDSAAFLKNLLASMMDKQLYNVLEFISRPHMGNDPSTFFMCACEPGRRTEVDCNDPKCVDGAKLWRFKPDGWWGTETIPPAGYYNFFTDYFYEQGGEAERISIYDQWIYNVDINRIITNKYLNEGFKSYLSKYGSRTHRSYNYINNIYPEQTELMNYRWKYGGYDITWLEYKLNKTYVYATFQSWYISSANIEEHDYYFIADEMTVKGHTDIAKTNTRAIFEKDEHILEELLGPKHCTSYDDNGNCIRFGYGDFLPNGSEISDLWLSVIGSDEKKDWPRGEVPEHHFIVKYNDTFEALSPDYINSDAYKSLSMWSRGIPPVDAFYCIEHSNGKIGGQTIFNNALGNEHRYFMKFKDFLSEQGWSLDDFISIYEEPIEDRIWELEHAIRTRADIRIKDYSEFYDKNHKSPFDGIEHYVPMIPSYDPDHLGYTGVKIGKRKIEIDQYGSEHISDVGYDTVESGDFTLGMNKDEFVYSIEAKNSLKIFISDYMRIRVKVNFNDTYATTSEIKLRISTSDFTYLNVREFEYYD